jgi:hypothetical protein
MIKKNQLLTRDAVKYKDLIEESLQYAEIDPAKMKFSISKKHIEPYAINRTIYIPNPEVIDTDSFVNSVAHEAKHIELNIAKTNLNREEIENICRKAGRQAQRAYEKVHGVSPMMALAYSIAKVPRIADKGQKTARRTIYAGIKL